MKCIVSGGRGFIGRRVVDQLLHGGHYVAIWSREPGRETRDAVGTFYWDPLGPEPAEESLNQYDAVVHLAGEPVAQRWTAEAKQKIRDSRVLGTKRLVDAIAKVDHKPSVLVCASAIGYYGSRGDEELDESSAIGEGFLAEVCRDWERESDRALDLGMRVVKLRIGVVLGPDGGALAAMLPAFRAFLGGRMGDGKQWMSWIHVDDLAAMVKWALETEVAGVVNAVAPRAVRNSQFTSELGKALGKPAFLQIPAGVLRVGMGEMSQVVLASAHVLPKVALAQGFPYQYPELAPALQQCVT
jgi:uncharacterized protein (TIGR01777 family)